MLAPLHNINRLVEDILNTNTSILGVGSFAYGVSDYWMFIKQLIKKVITVEKKMIILIDDDYPKIANLNKLITKKSKFKLGRAYNYGDTYPLDNYVSLKYDSVEFMDIINEIIVLNSKYNIEIYGINELIDNYNKYFELDDLKVIYNLYPQMKKDKSVFAQYIIKNRKQFAHPSKFMADFASFIYDTKKQFTLIVGHNEVVQVSKFGKFKTMGYMLRKKYGHNYKCIGTASKRGVINYVGTIEPTRKLYKSPHSYVFTDDGSLQRYLLNNFKLKSINIYKVVGDRDLYYFTTGQLKSKMDEYQYRNLKYLDYVIYFYVIGPTHNIIT